MPLAIGNNSAVFLSRAQFNRISSAVAMRTDIFRRVTIIMKFKDGMPAEFRKHLRIPRLFYRDHAWTLGEIV